MKKIFLSLILLFGIFSTQLVHAQCVPANCLSTLPAYGGICDTVLAAGRVGNAYSDFESFHTTTSCFDAALISPANAGTGVKITVIDNFTFTGLPTGLTAATNQPSYTSPANGCISVSGTPTQAGIFAVTANFLADVNAWPFSTVCSGFNVAQNNQTANYALDLIVLPKPNFTIPANTFCSNSAAVALTLATGSTAGGVFSGPGVSGANFNPATAGVGTHIIKYRVSAQQGAAVAPAVDSFTISVTVSNAVLASSNATNITCAVNGAATVTASSGTTPYSYIWSNGATSAGINNIAAGNYTVTVTDASGCSVSNTVTVSSTAVSLTTSAPVTANSACGGATGSASISATNGTAPYTYNWSNGGNIQTISNIPSGSYSVTITDASSCTGIVSNIVVNNPNSPTASISAANNVLCNAASTGSATVAATGGTAPYTYNWSNGGNTATVNNIAAGTYTVTVTDNASCLGVAAVTISQPSAVSITGTTTNILCFGQNTGAAAVTVSGGTTSYSYNWSNGGNTAAINNAVAGTYTLTVTDGNNCVINFTSTISQPAAAITLVPASTNILCAGAGNGTAGVTATGGTGLYTYNWSNSNTNPFLSFLQAGTYNVLVTDANGCSATVPTFTITEPSVLTVSATATDVTVFGASDGSVNLAISGGTGSYNYSWSNGATTQNINGVPAGTYSVTISDANGCQFIENATIDQPSTVTLSGFDDLSSLALYPNPGENILYIESTVLSGVSVNLQMFSIDGKLVKSQKYNQAFGLIEVSTVELPSGIYFITLQTELGNANLKWVKK